MVSPWRNIKTPLYNWKLKYGRLSLKNTKMMKRQKNDYFQIHYLFYRTLFI